MLDLIKSSIEAHGGLDRWQRIRKITATMTPDGLALKARGQEAFAKRPTQVTIDTRLQKTTFDPFLAPEQIGIYEPFRTAVESAAGATLEWLDNPRQSFTPNVPWSASQLVYFAGYAMWTYLTLPFSLLTDGVSCEEIEPWHEGGEVWRAIRVRFPASYVTHSSEQVLYFDSNALIRRQDYAVEIAGGGTAAHYSYDHQTFEGLVFPTRRRIYLRGVDGQPDRNVILMAADFENFEFVREEQGVPQGWNAVTCD